MAVDGSASVCQCRAVRSLIPGAAEAAARVVPLIRCSRNWRARSSVTNPSSGEESGRCHTTLAGATNPPIASAATGKPHFSLTLRSSSHGGSFRFSESVVTG